MGCESQQGRGHLSGAAGLAGWDLPPKLNFNLAHKSSSKSPPPLPVHSGCCVAALGSGTVEWDSNLEPGSETHRSLTTGDSQGPGLVSRVGTQ